MYKRQGYISGTYIATLLGGSVEPLQEVGRGNNAETLAQFIRDYVGSPLALYVDGEKYTLYPSMISEALLSSIPPRY